MGELEGEGAGVNGVKKDTVHSSVAPHLPLLSSRFSHSDELFALFALLPFYWFVQLLLFFSCFSTLRRETVFFANFWWWSRHFGMKFPADGNLIVLFFINSHLTNFSISFQIILIKTIGQWQRIDLFKLTLTFFSRYFHDKIVFMLNHRNIFLETLLKIYFDFVHKLSQKIILNISFQIFKRSACSS